MSSKITFYIARHGKTILNTLDKVQGWCDSPLTEAGVEVAEFLGAGMRDIRLDAVYTSDLRRTRETAEVVLGQQGQTDLPIVEVFGFREVCFGSYESDFNYNMWRDVALSLQYSNLEELTRDMFNGKTSTKEALAIVNRLDSIGTSETFEQVEKRAQDALIEIAQKESADNKDKNIFIIAHGMSIICLLNNWGGKELLKSHLENASICKVTYQDGKFAIETMGDMSYVLKGKSLKG